VDIAARLAMRNAPADDQAQARTEAAAMADAGGTPERLDRILFGHA
jgi:hypothetical protein